MVSPAGVPASYDFNSLICPSRTKAAFEHKRQFPELSSPRRFAFVDLIVTKKYADVPALTIVITPLPALTAQGTSHQKLARQPVMRDCSADPSMRTKKVKRHVNSRPKR